MDDLISRKEAIDSICRTVCDNPEICESPCDEIKVLEIMPSAQPETHDKRTETHGVCLDTIDRQAAIDALDKRFDSIPMEQTTEILLLRKDLRELPYAQPDLSGYSDKLWRNAYERGKAEAQRKKGMWIEHNPHKWGLGIVFKCSECGEKIDCEPSNYCPNCGAEMEDPEDIPMEYFENGGR